MGLDGLLVVVRTFPDGAVSGSSWQASFAILHVVSGGRCSVQRVPAGAASSWAWVVADGGNRVGGGR
jgi:hypothetical protein